MRPLTKTQIYQISAQIEQQPSKIPSYLNTLSKGVLDNELNDISLEVILQSSKISFDLVYNYFQQRQNVCILYHVAQNCPKTTVNMILFLSKYIMKKPEDQVLVALQTIYRLTRNSPQVFNDTLVLNMTLESCKYSLSFKFCTADALKVLSVISSLDLLPLTLQKLVLKYQNSDQKDVLQATYQTMAAGATNSDFTRLSYQKFRKPHKKIQSTIQLGQVLSESATYNASIDNNFIVEDSTSEEIENIVYMKSDFSFRKQQPKQQPTCRLPTFRKSHNVSESLPEQFLDEKLSQKKRFREMQLTGNYNIEFVDHMLNKIFEFQGNSLSQSSLRQFLQLLDQVEPCLPVIEEKLRYKTINYMLIYLNDNKKIVTPWLKQLIFSNVHLKTDQFNQLQYCVKNSMLLQDQFYPELQNIYRSLKEQVMSYGLGG
ncbi:hypothetical protein SS50377_22037 [Spironucleus salmonicida]|uniref:Uncharacterized protein n=1 Tax=Spironucleus salmonicida TaxID=348837 RepID=V6LNI2_9EUKA|nr:hypothetical protein SS50377_22037 [Spironucleus salmonicida]|eukprot:EST45798.1 Hypothetical protein SS50377_14372 [Spironucleus salmonicida]